MTRRDRFRFAEVETENVLHFIGAANATALITGTEDNHGTVPRWNVWLRGRGSQRYCTRCIGTTKVRGVCQAADALNLTVPGDIQVASLTDSSMAATHRPSITAVDIRLDRAGAAGVELMFEQLQGQSAGTIHPVVPEVRWRESA